MQWNEKNRLARYVLIIESRWRDKRGRFKPWHIDGKIPAGNDKRKALKMLRHEQAEDAALSKADNYQVRTRLFRLVPVDA